MLPSEILADLGNCRGVDPNIMYPEPGDERGEAIARSVCSDCVVVDLCRTEAFANHESGVWAGQTAAERTRTQRNIRREHSREQRALRGAGPVDRPDLISSPDF